MNEDGIQRRLDGRTEDELVRINTSFRLQSTPKEISRHLAPIGTFENTDDITEVYDLMLSCARRSSHGNRMGMFEDDATESHDSTHALYHKRHRIEPTFDL